MAKLDKRHRYRAFVNYWKPIDNNPIGFYVNLQNVINVRSGELFRDHCWVYWNTYENGDPPDLKILIEFSAIKKYYKRTYRDGSTEYKLGLYEIFFIKEITEDES